MPEESKMLKIWKAPRQASILRVRSRICEQRKEKEVGGLKNEEYS